MTAVFHHRAFSRLSLAQYSDTTNSISERETGKYRFMAMDDQLVVIPGDLIDSSYLPTAQKRKIGLGIKQDSHDFISTVAGRVDVDHRKKAAQIAVPQGRYVAKNGDNIICQVRGTSFETFHLYTNSYSPQVLLNAFSFEGASKKQRPQLKTGDVVYAKVIAAQRNMDVEVTCVNPSTGKADGLGPLTEGMIFDVSLDLANRLLKKQLGSVMDELGSRIPGGFELVVGKNGKVWVDCAQAGATGILAVGKILHRLDQEGLPEKDEKRFINRTLKELGLG